MSQAELGMGSFRFYIKIRFNLKSVKEFSSGKGELVANLTTLLSPYKIGFQIYGFKTASEELGKIKVPS